MRFFLISSEHLEQSLWFRDTEDFVVAMNYIAVLSVVTGVNILAFILMSNHVHFVLECSYEEAKHFFDALKRLYGAYYHKKYGIVEPLRKNSADIQEVPFAKESVERAIAYVLMNCVSANICATANGYPWSSASCIFNLNEQSGTPVGSLGTHRLRRILRSKTVLPSNYLLGDGGYILPVSYVKKEFVESLYHSPKRFNYFLNNSSKAKTHLEKNASPSFTDQVISEASSDLCRSLFRTNSLADLNVSEKTELIRQINRRFNADRTQIARVLEIPYTEVCQMLDSY